MAKATGIRNEMNNFYGSLEPSAYANCTLCISKLTVNFLIDQITLKEQSTLCS